FVDYMEEIHARVIFPTKYFGCLMAVFVEQEPITQDRIEQLTGYSKTTISQMLKLIQVNFPLKQVKKPGLRKKYYTIDVPPRDFMITFLKMIIDTYQDKTDFIPPLIEEIRPYTDKHPRFRNFKQFLEKFYEIGTLFLKLTTDTVDEFSNLIKTGQVKSSELSNLNLLSSQENLEKIYTLLKPPKVPSFFSDQRIMDEKLAEIYTQFKNKYYQNVRENLILAGSQTGYARTIIGTELLLEQRPVTQEEIQNATHFKRSTVSYILNILLDWKMIQLIKKPGDRKKYYMVIQSWDSRVINRIKLNIKYAIEVKEKITNLMEKIELRKPSKENKSLKAFFQHIHHSYEQYEQYFKLLEVKYLTIRLKDYLEKEKSNLA
ncbi:MAG: hypothetical protein ACFFDI_29405, partial [Promethearchaeota archaeon]